MSGMFMANLVCFDDGLHLAEQSRALLPGLCSLGCFVRADLGLGGGGGGGHTRAHGDLQCRQ